MFFLSLVTNKLYNNSKWRLLQEKMPRLFRTNWKKCMWSIGLERVISDSLVTKIMAGHGTFDLAD